MHRAVAEADTMDDWYDCDRKLEAADSDEPRADATLESEDDEFEDDEEDDGDEDEEEAGETTNDI